MNVESSFDADGLRAPEHAQEPDPRNPGFVKLTASGFEPLTLRDFHERMAGIRLNETVPKEIATQFDTTRNLYLYSWFVYRFFPIAEHQALVCLELALRKRYGSQISKAKRWGLSKLFQHAVRAGDIQNEGFERWRDAVRRRAINRYDRQLFERMLTEKLDRVEVDYSKIEIVEEDKSVDHVGDLVKYLPGLRNQYAHGSTSLHNQVRGTIHTVAEIINQLYKSAGSPSQSINPPPTTPPQTPT